MPCNRGNVPSNWMPLLIGAILMAAALGCGNRGPEVVPVAGVVTRDGKPVPKVFLEFIPDEGRPSWGVSDAEGKFALEYNKAKKGARTGSHTVRISFRPASMDEELARQRGSYKPHPDQKKIEEKYGLNAPEPLRVDITKAVADLAIKLD